VRLLTRAGHDIFTPTLTGLRERSHLVTPAVDLDTHILDVVNELKWQELRDVGDSRPLLWRHGDFRRRREDGKSDRVVRDARCFYAPAQRSIMMKRETFAVADVYVPVKRRATLVRKRVDEIAASMLDNGQQTPILVRADGARFVLVEGLHRLEAVKGLGEKTIVGFRVEARKH
jgi:sulfiredoxin